MNHWQARALPVLALALLSVGAVASSAFAATPTGEPTGLVATAVTPFEVRLNWTAPVPGGGDEITGYEIERANGSSAPGLFPTPPTGFTFHTETGQPLQTRALRLAPRTTTRSLPCFQAPGRALHQQAPLLTLPARRPGSLQNPPHFQGWYLAGILPLPTAARQSRDMR